MRISPARKTFLLGNILGLTLGITATITAQRWVPYALVRLLSRGDR